MRNSHIQKKNIKNTYDFRQKNIDLLNDSAKSRSEAIYKSIKK